jgi:predicted patatin/cPLA2 family phospholipase
MNNDFIIDESTALILEGGGMRGTFTSGVLDNFLDKGIDFPFTVAVSAGACNGLSYMSRQRGRARRSNIDLYEKYRYVGLKYLFTQRNIMDFKLLFETFPNEICPYDYDAFFARKERFVMVTTNCLTGEACYMEEKISPERVIEIVKASSSLPFAAPMVTIDDIPMLDGGIADSIPVQYAMNQGFKKFVIVLTRNKGYRKEEKNNPFVKLFYKKYPKLQEAINQRAANYNKTLDLIEKLEAEGKALVIRPEKPLQVSRIEKDINKLVDLYNEGFELTSRFVTQL